MIRQDKIQAGFRLLAFDDDECVWKEAEVTHVSNSGEVTLSDNDGFEWTDNIATISKDGKHYMPLAILKS